MSRHLSTAVDAIARVGDTITYRLALDLRGGLTRNVQVQDVLPGGMAVVDMVSINGDTTAAYTPPAGGPGSNFAYAPINCRQCARGRSNRHPDVDHRRRRQRSLR